ncbi:hypothetical protein EV666_1322 [Camelimonas lactis]|uniref:Uncharacterized protein n=1 Tax=Camelimonas lactis TaxID=659006 RepID=A0A4R2GHC8_9HYPH|nr:hypothetical protein EV666_1322 [Camelimonas lactis]
MSINLFDTQSIYNALLAELILLVLGGLFWMAAPFLKKLVLMAFLLLMPIQPSACDPPPTLRYASYSQVFGGTVVRPGVEIPARSGDGRMPNRILYKVDGSATVQTVAGVTMAQPVR